MNFSRCSSESASVRSNPEVAIDLTEFKELLVCHVDHGAQVYEKRGSIVKNLRIFITLRYSSHVAFLFQSSNGPETLDCRSPAASTGAVFLYLANTRLIS